jgi:hypothetical protein
LPENLVMHKAYMKIRFNIATEPEHSRTPVGWLEQVRLPEGRALSSGFGAARCS